jgi:hypothetical protein
MKQTMPDGNRQYEDRRFPAAHVGRAGSRESSWKGLRPGAPTYVRLAQPPSVASTCGRDGSPTDFALDGRTST